MNSYETKLHLHRYI